MDQQLQTKGFLQWFAFKRWMLFETSSSVKHFFRVIGLLLIATGVISFYIMYTTPQSKAIYSVMTNCLNKGFKGNICKQSILVRQKMKAPVYMFYYIENIYINHRKYLSSQSKQQLKGNIIGSDVAQKLCHPIVYNKDLNVTKSWAGYDLDPQAIANPCGLKAFFFFNDTYKLYDPQGQLISIKTKGVSLNINKNGKYKQSANSRKQQWINPQDQHFINWMQSQSLMTKKKLWGIIQQDLQPGSYTIQASNNYRVAEQKISKGIQLTPSSIMGGKLYVIPAFLVLLGLTSWIYTFYLYFRFNQYEQLLKNYRKQSL